MKKFSIADRLRYAHNLRAQLFSGRISIKKYNKLSRAIRRGKTPLGKGARTVK